MKKGRAETMTHDYKRNGTTTLFAALVAAKDASVTELKLGEVIGECMPRHRAKEFLRFLRKIDKLARAASTTPGSGLLRSYVICARSISAILDRSSSVTCRCGCVGPLCPNALRSRLV
jgi:hypothetical protein